MAKLCFHFLACMSCDQIMTQAWIFFRLFIAPLCPVVHPYKIFHENFRDFFYRGAHAVGKMSRGIHSRPCLFNRSVGYMLCRHG